MVEALYRKYRPTIFEDVVGQDTIERTLRNAISQDKVSHAYLFCGPRGTGKTTTARILAKALLCERGPTATPDGTCEDCQLIAEGRHPDVYELDAASRNGVENVREEIISRVAFAPVRGRFKIYIIDEVHMLSQAAFNSLLKTLEEPPDHVVFILCTTDPQKIPETILSRCQRFDFRRISVEAIVSRLGAICVAEGVEFEGEALDLIAHRAEGGMRNALTSLEQLIAFGDGVVTLDGAERMLGSMDSSALSTLVNAIGQRDAASCFRWVAEFVESGADLAQFTNDLADHIRNLYLMAIGVDDIYEISGEQQKSMTNQLKYFGSDRLARLLEILGELSQTLKSSSNPRLSFEIALTRMVRPQTDLTLEALAERLETLERQTRQGSSPQSSANQPVFETPPIPPKSMASMSTMTPALTPSKSLAPKEQLPTDQTPAPQWHLADDAQLQRIWQATLSALQKQSKAYGALFINTTLTWAEDPNTLLVEFPADSVFGFKAASNPEVQKALKEVLTENLGQEPRVHLVQAPKDKQSSNASKMVEGIHQSSVPESSHAEVAYADAPVAYSSASSAMGFESAQSANATRNDRPASTFTPHTPAQRESNKSGDEEVPVEAYERFDWEISEVDAKADATSAKAVHKENPQAIEPEPVEANLDALKLDQFLIAGFGEGLSFEEVDPTS